MRAGFQQAQQDGWRIAISQHTEEIALTPAGHAIRIDPQATGFGSIKTGAIVYRLLAGTPQNSCRLRQIQLAGRIETGMARNAVPIEYRLYVTTVTDRMGRWSPQAQRDQQNLRNDNGNTGGPFSGRCRLKRMHDDYLHISWHPAVSRSW
jgi:hypothetical protein